MVKRIFRYLKETSNYSPFYQGNDLQLRGYTDVDHGIDKDNINSTSGYVFTVESRAIICCSKKQSCVIVHSFSECYTLSFLVKFFLDHLDLVPFEKAIIIFLDNSALICLLQEPKLSWEKYAH